MSRKLTNPNPNHPHTRKMAILQGVKEQLRKMSTNELKKGVDIEIKKKVAGEVATIESIQWGDKPLEYRHQFIEFLLCVAEHNFKIEWKRNYGWDFDDSYDDVKLRGHIANVQNDIRSKDDLSKIENITMPDGYDDGELMLSGWLPYDKDVGYEKNWAIIQLKDGKIDPVWYWPNAGHFGPHKEEDVQKVLYARPRARGISTAIIGRDGVSMSRAQFDQLPKEEQDWCRADLDRRVKEIIDSGYAGVLGDGGIVDRRVFPTATPVQKNSMLNTPAPKQL
jgi:hypothetical protein